MLAVLDCETNIYPGYDFRKVSHETVQHLIDGVSLQEANPEQQSEVAELAALPRRLGNWIGPGEKLITLPSVRNLWS